MAKLSREIRLIVSSQKEQLLDIIDGSKSIEFILLERFGENSETIATLRSAFRNIRTSESKIFSTV